MIKTYLSKIFNGKNDEWVISSEREFQEVVSEHYLDFTETVIYIDEFCKVVHYKHKDDSYFDWKVYYQKCIKQRNEVII